MQNPSVEHSLIETLRENETLDSLFQRIAAGASTQNAAILKMFIFGSTTAEPQTLAAMQRVFNKTPDWPITWSDGGSCHNRPLAGVHAYILPNHAGNSTAIRRIKNGNSTIATIYEDSDARHCLIGGLTATNTTATPADQTQNAFDTLEKTLATAGFEIADIARTWFYNDRLLDWYDDFNKVRTPFYNRKKFRTGVVPASTAVYGKNPQNSALALAAWAIIPKTQNAIIREVESPLQCPALDYGSAFARAMQITTGGSTRVTVSGTASIEPGGKTIHLDDVPAQIDLSMRVVEAILATRNLTLDDTTRAFAYCKAPATAALFAAWLQSRNITNFPYIPVHCDICRHDLLFEIELDAQSRP